MITVAASRVSGVASSTPNTTAARERSAPSMLFRATLPVNPSVTITSARPGCMKSEPSTLPTKPGTLRSSSCAWRRRVSPLPGSSPLESSPIVGASSP